MQGATRMTGRTKAWEVKDGQPVDATETAMLCGGARRWRGYAWTLALGCGLLFGAGAVYAQTAQEKEEDKKPDVAEASSNTASVVSTEASIGLRVKNVALAPRDPRPPVILDAVPGLDFDPDLAADNVGILHIRSVYDVDGEDTAPSGITALRDPAQVTADERPARFVRIEKAVGLPDDEVRDFRGSAFGVAGRRGMREILGYAPVEPPDVLFHGTVDRFLPSIRKEGLVRGSRHHVHLSVDEETAIKVGQRRGRPVVLEVRAGAMHRDGFVFYVSENGVWLTDNVPPEYIGA